jgi:HEAT repeat protein
MSRPERHGARPEGHRVATCRARDRCVSSNGGSARLRRAATRAARSEWLIAVRNAELRRAVARILDRRIAVTELRGEGARLAPGMSAHAIDGEADLADALRAESDTALAADIAWLAGRLTTAAALEPLLVAAAHPAWEVRFWGVDGLAHFTFESALRCLRRALSDADPGVAIRAAEILVDRRDPAAAPRLRAWLGHTDQSAAKRVAAARELAWLEDTSAIGALRLALADADPDVRAACADALADLRATEAIPQLRRLAECDEAVVTGGDAVAQHAEWALAQLGAVAEA